MGTSEDERGYQRQLPLADGGSQLPQVCEPVHQRRAPVHEGALQVSAPQRPEGALQGDRVRQGQEAVLQGILPRRLSSVLLIVTTLCWHEGGEMVPNNNRSPFSLHCNI